ncbi:MAG: hypothetical protein ACFFDT_34815, partial [Candidatus Hodarchaeota archaeon]
VYLNTSAYIPGEHMYLYFLMEEFDALGEEKGYSVVLWLDPPASIAIVKRVIGNEVLGSYDYNTNFSERQHITITRTQEGHFNIFVNGSLVIEAMDNELTESKYFGFDTPGTHSFDNITVDAEIAI